MSSKYAELSLNDFQSLRNGDTVFISLLPGGRLHMEAKFRSFRKSPWVRKGANRAFCSCSVEITRIPKDQKLRHAVGDTINATYSRVMRRVT